MKIIWRLKSVPEFQGLSKQESKEAWMQMHRKNRAAGECQWMPIATGLITAAFMLIFIFAFKAFSPSDQLSFCAMILFSGTGGFLGGVLAMTITYKFGRKHLPEIIGRSASVTAAEQA